MRSVPVPTWRGNNAAAVSSLVAAAVVPADPAPLPVIPPSIVDQCALSDGQRWEVRQMYLPAASKGLVSSQTQKNIKYCIANQSFVSSTVSQSVTHSVTHSS